jgi:hypothetical protein
VRWLLLLEGLVQQLIGAAILYRSQTILEQIAAILLIGTSWMVIGIAFMVSHIQRASKKNLEALERIRNSIESLKRTTTPSAPPNSAFDQIRYSRGRGAKPAPAGGQGRSLRGHAPRDVARDRYVKPATSSEKS